VNAADTVSTFAAATTSLASPAVSDVPKAATAPISGLDDDLMNLLAAEHANSQKKDSGAFGDENEFDIDYLLKVGAL